MYTYKIMTTLISSSSNTDSHKDLIYDNEHRKLFFFGFYAGVIDHVCYKEYNKDDDPFNPLTNLHCVKIELPEAKIKIEKWSHDNIKVSKREKSPICVFEYYGVATWTDVGIKYFGWHKLSWNKGKSGYDLVQITDELISSDGEVQLDLFLQKNPNLVEQAKTLEVFNITDMRRTFENEEVNLVDDFLESISEKETTPIKENTLSEKTQDIVVSLLSSPSPVSSSSLSVFKDSANFDKDENFERDNILEKTKELAAQLLTKQLNNANKPDNTTLLKEPYQRSEYIADELELQEEDDTNTISSIEDNLLSKTQKVAEKLLKQVLSQNSMYEDENPEYTTLLENTLEIAKNILKQSEGQQKNFEQISLDSGDNTVLAETQKIAEELLNQNTSGAEKESEQNIKLLEETVNVATNLLTQNLNDSVVGLEGTNKLLGDTVNVATELLNKESSVVVKAEETNKLLNETVTIATQLLNQKLDDSVEGTNELLEETVNVATELVNKESSVVDAKPEETNKLLNETVTKASQLLIEKLNNDMTKPVRKTLLDETFEVVKKIVNSRNLKKAEEEEKVQKHAEIKNKTPEYELLGQALKVVKKILLTQKLKQKTKDKKILQEITNIKEKYNHYLPIISAYTTSNKTEAANRLTKRLKNKKVDTNMSSSSDKKTVVSSVLEASLQPNYELQIKEFQSKKYYKDFVNYVKIKNFDYVLNLVNILKFMGDDEKSKWVNYIKSTRKSELDKVLQSLTNQNLSIEEKKEFNTWIHIINNEELLKLENMLKQNEIPQVNQTMVTDFIKTYKGLKKELQWFKLEELNKQPLIRSRTPDVRANIIATAKRPSTGVTNRRTREGQTEYSTKLSQMPARKIAWGEKKKSYIV